ncbi:hypothetical protein E3N88_09189 [Mikania micrantha]|uniref:Uncharacterized protein n=1 Tax=Mikania micrantha TaxID=192012 RepID=A0A5N6PKL9_9ASTR|nr:hypothetical protein E3N88_09189 [Mikania micrantha]
MQEFMVDASDIPLPTGSTPARPHKGELSPWRSCTSHVTCTGQSIFTKLSDRVEEEEISITPEFICEVHKRIAEAPLLEKLKLSSFAMNNLNTLGEILIQGSTRFMGKRYILKIPYRRVPLA